MSRVIESCHLDAKLTLAAGLMLATAMGLLFFAVSGLADVAATAEKFAAVRVPRLLTAMEAAMALSSASTQEKNAILESGQAAMAERQRQFQQHVVSSLATLEELRRIAPPASQTMMAEALHEVRAHEQASGQIMALTMARQDAEASQLSLGEARRAGMRTDEILTSVVQANRKEIAEESAMAAAAQEDLRRPLILAALLGLAFAFAMLFWIARYQISLPLSRITQGMGRVAAGELEVFKQNALEARRLAAEQAREQEAKEGRAARLNTLIRSFKGSVNVLTGHLASASTELEATA